MDSVRIDKWLWAARFFKTRSLASQAVSGGHVDVNGSRVKPARAVQAGDLLAIRRDQIQWTVQVLAVSDRRGPATVARTLYAETEASIAKRERQQEERRAWGSRAASPSAGRTSTNDGRSVNSSKRVNPARRGPCNEPSGR